MHRDFTLNYPIIPALAIGFTRSNSLIAKVIQFFRKILDDKAEPNHSFIVTEDHGQKFATEETPHGLREQSLEQYIYKNNRIVAMYLWNEFKDPGTIDKVETYLAEIRRRFGEESKYDWKGLFHFVPIVKKFVKPDPKRQWCSENCASILKKYGAGFIVKTEIAPDELLKIMKASDECNAVLNYYK